MTDLDYFNQTEILFSIIEKNCDLFNENNQNLDIDVQKIDGVLTLTFDNNNQKDQIVINRQKPLKEIWLASRTGGFHFKFDGKIWLDTKTNEEFFNYLNNFVSQITKTKLEFKIDI